MLAFQTVQLPGVSIVLSALIALIGLVVYFVSRNPKVMRIAEISYLCGLLAFLLLWK